MDNIWDILGLAEPTTKEKAIKKAYAKRLKKTSLEDSPDAFQALRKAYEEALAWAEGQRFKEKSFIERAKIAPSQEIFQRDIEIETESNQTLAPLPPSIVQDLELLFNHSKKRRKMKHWEAIMAKAGTLGIDDHAFFETNLHEKLLNIYGFRALDLSKPLGYSDRSKMDEPPVPPRIIEFLFDEMNWNGRTPHDPGLENQREWIKIRAGYHEYEAQQLKLSLVYAAVIIVFFLFILPVSLLKFFL